MPERPTVRITNWGKFQHYTKRNPPWIRLYRDLIDRDEWRNLSDSAARLLVELWLLASETEPGGKVPHDINLLAWRTGRASEDASAIASALEELAEQGFITFGGDSDTPASTNASADASTDTPQSTETEDRVQKKKKPPTEAKKKAKRWRVVPEGWEPTDTHRKMAAEMALDFDLQVAKYRDHEYDRPKSDPDRTFNNWLREAAERASRSVRTIQPANGKRYHRTPAEVAEMFPDE